LEGLQRPTPGREQGSRGLAAPQAPRREPGDDRAVALPDRLGRRDRGPLGPALRLVRGRGGARGAPADEELDTSATAVRPTSAYDWRRGPDAHDAPTPDPGALLPASGRGNRGALHSLWKAHLSRLHDPRPSRPSMPRVCRRGAARVSPRTGPAGGGRESQ